MEKKNWIAILLVQLIISGVVATSELRYVREGYNVTFTCTTTSSEPHMNWEYLSAGENPVRIAINENVYGSFKDRLSANIPTEGTYRLTLFFFNSGTDSGRYSCYTTNLAVNNFVDIMLAEGPSAASVKGISPVFADGTNYLTLTCTHDTATPNVIYQWWRNGAEITGNITSTLTLSSVQASDNGANITCTAMNSVYDDIQASDSVILTVYYGPDTANITGNHPVFADGNNILTLTCGAAAFNPAVTFQWTQNGVNVGDNSNTLTFNPVLESDNGLLIECIAKNNEDQNRKATDNASLTVHYGPTSLSIEGNKTVYADGINRLTLRCEATHYSPDIHFQWREGHTNFTGENTDTYTKIAVKSDNGKIISCLVWNSLYPDETKDTSVQLAVYYACKTDIWVSATNPSEGDPVTFVCKCDSNPAATFTIKRPTGEIIYRRRLDIEFIVRIDTGEYVCSAGNEHGKQDKTIAILVNYAPEVKVTFPVTASEGERGVQLLCEADGIPNSYNFGKWRQLGPTDYVDIQQLHGTHSGNQSLLTFDKPLSYEDSGFYECKVNNGVWDRRQMLDQSVMKYLQVMGSPKILEKDDTTYGIIGQMIKVEVSFYSVPEFTVATWFALFDRGQHNVVDVSLNVQQTVGQRTTDATYHDVTVHVNGYVATLLFKNMTRDNIGTYVIVIANEKGQESYTKKLEIKQTIVTTKENIDSPAIGVVAGAAAGTLIIVIIIVIVVVVLCKRGVITKPNSECLKGNGSTSTNVYQNQAFSPETAAGSHIDETVYQEIGPSVDPNMHYETLTTENNINQ